MLVAKTVLSLHRVAYASGGPGIARSGNATVASRAASLRNNKRCDNK